MRALHQKQMLWVMPILLIMAVGESVAHASIFNFDYSVFSKIPVQDQGRVKPLDTFAKSYLEGFSGRDSLPQMEAINWLAELLFDPEQAYKRQVFNIPNPSLIDALELEHRDRHRYAYAELSAAFTNHFKTWHSLFMKSKEELTLEQQQMVELFNKTQVYADIAQSLSLVFPAFEVPAGHLAELFEVEPGTAITYIEMSKRHNQLQESSKKILAKMKAGETVSEDDRQILQLEQKLSEIVRDQNSQILRIVPPQWEGQSEEWLSPWTVIQEGFGSPQNAEFLRMWQSLIVKYHKGDTTAWNKEVRDIRAFSLKMAKAKASDQMLTLETNFNHWKLFQKSLYLYLTAFLVILTGYLFWPAVLRRIAFMFLGVGFVTHLSGILTRMTIMHRPPVTSLYESIIFVSLIAVLFGIILELRKKDGMGIIIASAVGTVLHFIGLKYDADGDTMGMLVAVLNTNFWLSTHVVTITIGYGCTLVGGIIGHVYLISRIVNPSDKNRLSELYRNLQGVSIVAIFFASLGTILGGIWADQSWGRFWGWDPKENGALLIVLWLAWNIHGRISGKLDELGFATGMTCATIMVALAWFGVNLLSVGLHSYGFTQSAALNLFLFCGFEVVFALGCYFTIRFRQKTI